MEEMYTTTAKLEVRDYKDVFTYIPVRVYTRGLRDDSSSVPSSKV
jgi:hypothetical protein